jgi:acetyltransferase-like isoleucine patch superfamily enzyme
MGCQIGQRTIVIEPMQCFDWNAVKFDDDCVVGGFLQFHTFENMILKVKQTHIQDGCAISSGATVMGGVVIERDTTLLPLSLVLKDMMLLSTTYQGSPVEPVARQNSHVGTEKHIWRAERDLDRAGWIVLRRM